MCLGEGLCIFVIVVEFALGYKVFLIVCEELASEVVSVVLLKYPSLVQLKPMIIDGL